VGGRPGTGTRPQVAAGPCGRRRAGSPCAATAGRRPAAVRRRPGAARPAGSVRSPVPGRRRSRPGRAARRPTYSSWINQVERCAPSTTSGPHVRTGPRSGTPMPGPSRGPGQPTRSSTAPAATAQESPDRLTRGEDAGEHLDRGGFPGPVGPSRAQSGPGRATGSPSAASKLTSRLPSSPPGADWASRAASRRGRHSLPTVRRGSAPKGLSWSPDLRASRRPDEFPVYSRRREGRRSGRKNEWHLHRFRCG
jgi:hypothetical protein